MSDAFDPYYIWLGIPPEEQPPNHYRLLGVTLFEDNSEVIEAAANRQMAYMQEISAGDEHIDLAQKILGELSRARICLLNSEKKADYDAELRDSVNALVPPSESLSTPPVAADEAEQSAAATAKKQASLAIVVVALLIIFFGGLWLLFNRSETDEEKPVVQQFQESLNVEQENPELEEANRKLAEAKNQAEAAEQKLKEQEARNAAAEAKKQAAAEAKEQAAAEAKTKAEAEAKKQAAAEAKTKAEAEAEAKKQAKENAKRKAEEAEREAQKLRDNPDKLLESKGFKKKGTKWVFAQEEKLKLVTSELTKEWRRWKKLTPKNEAALKAKLEIYNKLLLASFENSAVRLAVREDLTSVLEEPDVAAALVKLNVKTTELNKSAKALQKPDSKLRKAIYEKPIFPGKPGHRYAALIINEKESAVVHLDPEAMGEKDAPSLFILPRAKWTAAGGTRGQPKEIWMNRTWPTYILETSGATIRCGLFRVSNPTVHLMPTHGEGGVPNGETNFGGKAGPQGWTNFFSQMKPHTIEPSVGAIEQARQTLDAYQPDQKK